MAWPGVASARWIAQPAVDRDWRPRDLAQRDEPDDTHQNWCLTRLAADSLPGPRGPLVAPFYRRQNCRQPHLLVRPNDPTRTVVVPVHGNRALEPGTLWTIIRQAGFSVEEFGELL